MACEHGQTAAEVFEVLQEVRHKMNQAFEDDTTELAEIESHFASYSPGTGYKRHIDRGLSGFFYIRPHLCYRLQRWVPTTEER